MKYQFDLDTIEQIEEAFQELANKRGCFITVCWNQERHRAFTPQKQDDSQFTLDGMELPKITEFLDSGE